MIRHAAAAVLVMLAPMIGLAAAPGATAATNLARAFTTGAATTSVTIYLHGWYGEGTYDADDMTLTGPGGSPPSSPAVPAGLAVTGVTSSSASLSWTEASGSDSAASYDVYENGSLAATAGTKSAAVASQLESLYGWPAATAWSHIGITLMNGHTDQPSELFTQANFTSLLSFARTNHVAWFTFWSFNRDQPCPAGAVEPWAPGTCSNISQNPYDFTKIVAQYAG
jgi:hypothetical protein